MKISILFFFGFLMSYNIAYSQSEYLHEYINPKLYKGKGIVFTQNYKPGIMIKDKRQLFDPTDQVIEVAELILFDRYNKDLEKYRTFKKLKNVQKAYKKYNRQYIGYTDSDGNMILIINMLNFSCEKSAKRHFEGWEKDFFIGSGDYYEKNTIRYKVNLTKRTLDYL